MGVIVKNDIYYGTGGGGDNSKELSYEEYQALSEEEKSNGTTYYVTDIAGNTLQIPNMRYVIETDMVQIKDSAGNWHDWKSGGLKDFNVLDTIVSDWTKVTSYKTNPVFDLSSGLLMIGSSKLDDGSEYGTGEIIYRTKLIDLTRYNVLKITGFYHYYMWNSATAYGYINLVDINGNKTNLYTKSFGGQINAQYEELPGVTDVSACNGEYYLEFYIKDNTSTQRFEITNIVFGEN